MRGLKTKLTTIGTAAKAVNAGLDQLRDGIVARIAEAEAELRVEPPVVMRGLRSADRPPGRHRGDGRSELVAADDAGELGVQPPVAVDDEDPGRLRDAPGLGVVGEHRGTSGRIELEHWPSLPVAMCHGSAWMMVRPG